MERRDREAWLGLAVVCFACVSLALAMSGALDRTINALRLYVPGWLSTLNLPLLPLLGAFFLGFRRLSFSTRAIFGGAFLISAGIGAVSFERHPLAMLLVIVLMCAEAYWFNPKSHGRTDGDGRGGQTRGKGAQPESRSE